MAVVKVEREHVVKESHKVVQCDVCGKQGEFDEMLFSPPEGWVQLRCVSSTILVEQRGRHDFCSWQCCRYFVRLQVDSGN